MNGFDDMESIATGALREIGQMAQESAARGVAAMADFTRGSRAVVRQNIYAAWLDGEVSAVEALHSLCADYEELDQTYRQYEGMREQTRQQLSEVLEKMGGKAEVKGFGVLTITAPV